MRAEYQQRSIRRGIPNPFLTAIHCRGWSPHTVKPQRFLEFRSVPSVGKQDNHIKDLLIIANRILITLGPGYLPQIYRRAFHHELRSAGTEFRNAREISAEYQGETLGSKEVNFFIIRDLIISIVAVRELDDLLLHRFWNHIRHFRLTRGLIFNFKALRLDFRYYCL